MRSSIIAAGIFAVSALAGPLVTKRDYETCGGGSGDDGDGTAPPPCLTFDEATLVADHFKELQVDYSDEAADAYLTEDFTDYSDSVITLINGACTDGPLTVSILVSICETNLSDDVTARRASLLFPRGVQGCPGRAGRSPIRDPQPVAHLRHRRHPLAHCPGTTIRHWYQRSRGRIR